MFVMIRIGSSGLPVAFAGHASVHRPHSVHAYPSRSCRHDSCSTRFAPNPSDFSRSTFFSAPFGVRSMKIVFTMAKTMCMRFDYGTYAGNEDKRTTWVHQDTCHHTAGSLHAITPAGTDERSVFDPGADAAP